MSGTVQNYLRGGHVVKKVKEDLTGKLIGRWRVLRRSEDKVSKTGKIFDMWICQCTCQKQTIKEVYGDNLRSGKSLSCGCISRETRHKNSLNVYEFVGNYCIGYTSNKEPFYLDKEDYEKIKDFVWYIGDDGYVVTHNPNKRLDGEHNLIRMHRFVLNINDDNVKVDHKNRKRNDNCKNNLRIATPQQNMMNCGKQTDSIYSKYKGVCFHKKAKKWVSYIRIDGKRVHLGIFNSEIEAAKAYEEAAKKHFGEFACVEPGEEGAWNVC